MARFQANEASLWPGAPNAKRRRLVTALPALLGYAAMAPRAAFGCADPQPPDVVSLDEFPGVVGNPNWTRFALDLLEAKPGDSGRQAAPVLHSGNEWTERIALSTPNLAENIHSYPITFAFNDAGLPDGHWCCELLAILESELQVIDPKDRHMTVKAHQLLFRGAFAREVIPRISLRIKLASKYSRLGVIARVEAPDGDLFNIPGEFKLSGVYGCGWDRIYATSAEEFQCPLPPCTWGQVWRSRR